MNTSSYKDKRKDNVSDFVIRSPYTGLTERIMALHRVTDEMVVFKERIDHDYQMDLKRKP
jgi:hypothetical protein